MEKDYWHLGYWRRIPVEMHWTVLLAFAWMYLIFFDLVASVIGAVALFVLFVVHELGHVIVLRRRRIAVERIQLFGIHGKTSHEWASSENVMFVAWGGVAAQLVVLLVALALAFVLARVQPSSLAWTIAGPVLLVWTRLNVFLMVIALLPIGPFDGRAAWYVIPWLRAKWRKRRRLRREARQFAEQDLPPEKQRALEESSTKAAAELLAKFGKNEDHKKRDA